MKNINLTSLEPKLIRISLAHNLDCLPHISWRIVSMKDKKASITSFWLLEPLEDLVRNELKAWKTASEPYINISSWSQSFCPLWICWQLVCHSLCLSVYQRTQKRHQHKPYIFYLIADSPLFLSVQFFCKLSIIDSTGKVIKKRQRRFE